MVILFDFEVCNFQMIGRGKTRMKTSRNTWRRPEAMQKAFSSIHLPGTTGFQNFSIGTQVVTILSIVSEMAENAFALYENPRYKSARPPCKHDCHSSIACKSMPSYNFEYANVKGQNGQLYDSYGGGPERAYPQERLQGQDKHRQQIA